MRKHMEKILKMPQSIDVLILSFGSVLIFFVKLKGTYLSSLVCFFHLNPSPLPSNIKICCTTLKCLNLLVSSKKKIIFQQSLYTFVPEVRNMETLLQNFI